jgi:hypothetical protein
MSSPKKAVPRQATWDQSQFAKQQDSPSVNPTLCPDHSFLSQPNLINLRRINL